MWVRCWVFGDVGLSLGLTKPNSAYYVMIAEFFVFFSVDEVTRLLSLLFLPAPPLSTAADYYSASFCIELSLADYLLLMLL